MRPCYNPANNLGLNNNFSVYSSEGNVLYISRFQQLRDNGSHLRHVHKVYFLALAVTWLLSANNSDCDGVVYSVPRWGQSCHTTAYILSVICLCVCLLFHPEAWVSVWLALHLTNPWVSEPAFACFHFLVSLKWQLGMAISFGFKTICRDEQLKILFDYRLNIYWYWFPRFATDLAVGMIPVACAVCFLFHIHLFYASLL